MSSLQRWLAEIHLILRNNNSIKKVIKSAQSSTLIEDIKSFCFCSSCDADPQVCSGFFVRLHCASRSRSEKRDIAVKMRRNGTRVGRCPPLVCSSTTRSAVFAWSALSSSVPSFASRFPRNRRTLMEGQRPLGDNLYKLPDNLPVPQDDGGCDHLVGLSIPEDVSLVRTRRDGEDEKQTAALVNLSQLKGRTVIFCYPRTGRPNAALPIPNWNDIPGNFSILNQYFGFEFLIQGARGCTPHSCGFRDFYQQFRALGVTCYGLSTQTTEYQQESRDRLHLPYDLLSDVELKLTRALKLPTFTVDSKEVPEPLIKRLAFVLDDTKIVKVFYPVFPPDKNAETVLEWLREDKGKGN